MFKLFRKNAKQEIKPHPTTDKAASVIAKALIRLQTSWAGWLSAKEKNMTLKQKKQALIIFCVLMSVWASSILYKGIFLMPMTSPTWLKTPTVTLPEDSRLPDSLNLDYLRELYKNRKASQSPIDSIQH